MKVNGVELYVEERGEGVPLIAVHGGLGYDHSYLKPALEPLEDVFRVVYYDQRGNGRSERVPIETLTIPQLADDIEALRAALDLDRFALLGHSYGGFVALQYATKHPERLSHLLVPDTGPGAFGPTEDELAERGDRSWITPEVHAAAEAMSAPPTTDDDFLALVPRIAPIYLYKAAPDELTRQLQACVLDAKAAVQGFVALAGWSVASDLGKITCPTLVLCGRYDLLTTPECSKRLSSAIPDADLVWFEESGHFPWLEEPDMWDGAVRGWIRDRPAARS